jgi:hypothetical protein
MVETLKKLIDTYFGDLDSPKNEITLQGYVKVEEIKNAMIQCSDGKGNIDALMLYDALFGDEW